MDPLKSLGVRLGDAHFVTTRRFCCLASSSWLLR
jgi:hypothetical protein